MTRKPFDLAGWIRRAGVEPSVLTDGARAAYFEGAEGGRRLFRILDTAERRTDPRIWCSSELSLPCPVHPRSGRERVVWFWRQSSAVVRHDRDLRRSGVRLVTRGCAVCRQGALAL